MRRPQGQAIETGPAGQVKVADTFTCFHCQQIVEVGPRQDAASLGGLCKICSGLICAECAAARAAGGDCTPWKRRMEEMEARERALRSYRVL